MEDGGGRGGAGMRLEISISYFRNQPNTLSFQGQFGCAAEPRIVLDRVNKPGTVWREEYRLCSQATGWRVTSSVFFTIIRGS